MADGCKIWCVVMVLTSLFIHFAEVLQIIDAGIKTGSVLLSSWIVEISGKT